MTFYVGSVALAGCAQESPRCSKNLGIDITNVVIDAYNDVVRAMPTAGTWTFSCNRSGSATITGTVDPNAVSFDLTLALDACAHDALVLDGVLHDATMNGASLSMRTERAESDALAIRGTATACEAPLDATCAVDIYFRDGTYITDICGLTYP